MSQYFFSMCLCMIKKESMSMLYTQVLPTQIAIKCLIMMIMVFHSRNVVVFYTIMTDLVNCPTIHLSLCLYSKAPSFCMFVKRLHVT